ncbi:MAG: sulfatase, partial [Akkermansiaceae bacterium]|nr:sulfatase [Akkermansiaceae bacterium]
SAYGSQLIETPNIDRIAREGMLFRNAFVTNSICAPSRAVLLTGKYSHLNGLRDNRDEFDGSQLTFPKLLQKAGYQTAIIGKWHLKSQPTGFDYWEILPGQGSYYNPVFIKPDGRKRYTGYCTTLTTDLALDWLEKRTTEEAQQRPFLLMCQHKAPHRNWMPALRHLPLYDDIQIPEPATLFDDWKDNASPARWQELEIDGHMDLHFDLFYQLTPDYDGQSRKGRFDQSAWRNMQRMTPTQLHAWRAHYAPKDAYLKDAKLTGKDLVRWKFQRYAKNYLRCVKGVDESVGTIMEQLDQLGLSDNTIVVYSSDQGFYIGDHGWYDKRWMYEESLKMPLVIKWPGVTKPGSVDEHLVQNLDYAETFLEAAGARVPDDMQGHSLVPLLKGEKPADWRDAIYYHYYEYPSVHQVPKQNGVRTDRFKLIQFYEFGEWEFYDLREDPEELHNVYNDPKYTGQVAAMKKKLEDLRKYYADDTVTGPKPAEWQKKHRTKQFRVPNTL